MDRIKKGGEDRQNWLNCGLWPKVREILNIGPQSLPSEPLTTTVGMGWGVYVNDYLLHFYFIDLQRISKILQRFCSLCIKSYKYNKTLIYIKYIFTFLFK